MNVEQLRKQKVSREENVFIVLAAFFIASLVLTNLIAGRFFQLKIDYFNINWSLSSGIIAYPVTFLITDVISEIYGEKKAKSLVIAGFIVSVFTVIIILISTALPISAYSPVDNTSYNNVFGLAPGIVFGSMIAYLFAQYIDVKLFEFWRKLTKGKHLWLRNNGSTIFSQLIDTSLVVIIALILFPKFTGVSNPISWHTALQIIIGQYIFKAILALLDTPIFYLFVFGLKKYFGEKHIK